ncbi:hypothetical protein BDV23DRAFT_161901 [Aspergillus alliaceus]|uniref:Lysine-specific metallo-endopeptidase domain-containing protein n=1 Tax=Petromyces alliaceus TaxID=209559 RepID=A0A5N7BZ07_PETAA|nr:hypothetical protein BDV23DRAFT_161901 [Aspergillus alliaceus]
MEIVCFKHSHHAPTYRSNIEGLPVCPEHSTAMNLLGYSAQPCGWILISLTLLFLGFDQPALASPFHVSGLVDTRTELEPSLRNLTFSVGAANQQHKRGDEPKGLRLEATCSPAQQRYLLSSFSEARTQAERAEQAMKDLIQIFKEKTQPKDWNPHKYTTLYRNFKLWGNFFGLPILKRNDGEVTIAQTIANMNKVRIRFTKIKNALENSGRKFDLIVNCNDNWLVYENDRIDENGDRFRRYKDTREKHKGTSVYVETQAPTMTCRENPAAKAYSFYNEMLEQEEMVLCPLAWNKWAGEPPPFLSDFAGTPFSGMKGKYLTLLKNRAAGNTLLHEAFHSWNILEKQIVDMPIQHEGATKGAYGATLVQALARKDPNQALQNADTHALFALGVYYDKCNWANPTGKCLDDSPDTICPEDGKTKKRNCITIDWD